VALTVETGAGIEDAESYCDIDFVDQYCRKRGHTSWSESSNNTLKEAAIIRAMDYIETLTYNGEKADSTNILKFPRSGIYLENILVESDEIPLQLKYALCEGSVVELDNKSGLFSTTQGSSGNIKRKRTDVLETEYFRPGNINTPYPTIKKLLGDLTSSSFGVYTLTRS
jgi:hypothetical protein